MVEAIYKRGSKVLLFVTYVERACKSGKCEVWAQPNQNTGKYGMLERLIELYQPGTRQPPADVFPCDIMLARYSDSMWYRVQVIDKIPVPPGTPDVHVQVLFIDFGNTDVVKQSDLVEPDGSVLGFPSLAEHFVVDGLKPSDGFEWNSTELELMNSSLINSEFTAEILDPGTIGLSATIRIDLPENIRAAIPIMPSNGIPSVPQTMSLGLGQCFEVTITQVDSLLNFCIHLTSIQKDLCQMNSAIKTKVIQPTAERFTADQIHVGLVCAVSHPPDGIHRAVITGISNGYYQITYLDYGETNVVTINDIYPMTGDLQALCRVPAQAVRCCIYGRCAEQGTAHFRDLVALGRVFAKSRGSTESGRHLVELYSDITSVGTVSLGPSLAEAIHLAVRGISSSQISPNMPPGMRPAAAMIRAPSGLLVRPPGYDLSRGAAFPQQITRPPGISPALSIATVSGIPQQLSMPGQVAYNTGMDMYQIGRGMGLLSASTPMMTAQGLLTQNVAPTMHAGVLSTGQGLKMQAMPQSIHDFKPITVSIGACQTVCISSIETDGSFYIQLLSNAKQLDSLMSEISMFATACQPLPAGSVVPGRICLVILQSDGVVYRGKVMDDGSVMLVDFGKRIDVVRGDGKVLNGVERFIAVPNQALHCRVADMNEACSVSTIASVLQQYESKIPLAAKFVGATTDDRAMSVDKLVYTVSLVHLSSANIDMNISEMIRLSSGADSLNPPPADLAPGCLEAVTVLAVLPGPSGSCDLFGQLNKYSADTLNTFQDQLNTLYGKERIPCLLDHVQIGRYCVCKYDVDGQYYRGKVSRKVGSQFLVDFIDFGSQSMFDIVNIKILLSQFCSLPHQGIRFIVDTGSTDLKSIEDTVMNSELVVLALGPPDNGVYKVQLPADKPSNQPLLSLIKTKVTSAGTMDHHKQLGTAPVAPSGPYPVEEVRPGEWLSCNVSHAEDPENFYVQLVSSDTDTLTAIMDELQGYVDSQPHNSRLHRQPALGSAIIAKFADDGVWYRACITGVLRRGEQFEVHFVDYGNRGVVGPSELRDISPSLQSYPMQAISCCLEGIHPSVSGVWNDNEISRFQEICLDKDFQLFWSGQRDRENRRFVHLLDGQENINRSFLREVRKLKDDYNSPVVVAGGPMSHSSPLSPRPIVGRANPSLQAQPPSDGWSGRNDAISPRQQTGRGRNESEGRGAREQSFGDGARGSRFGSQQNNEQSSNFEKSGSGFNNRSEGFGQRSERSNQKSEDFGQRSGGFGQKSEGFGQKSEGFGQRSGGFNQRSEAGDSSGFGGGRQSGFRGRDEGNRQSGFGGRDEGNRQSGFGGRDRDEGNRQSGFGGRDEGNRQSGFGGRDRDEGNRQSGFGGRDEGNRQSGFGGRDRDEGNRQSGFGGRDGGNRQSGFGGRDEGNRRGGDRSGGDRGPRGDGFSGGSSRGGGGGGFGSSSPRKNDFNKGGSGNASRTSSTTAFKTEEKPSDYQLTKWSSGRKVKCVVAFSLGPAEFFIQPSDSSKLDEMMNELNTACESGTAESLTEVKVASPCAARFSEDNTWYRGRVVSIEGENIKIQFIDYGNSESVSKDNLRALPHKFLTSPVRCLACCLSGVQASDGDWSEEVVTKFDEVTQGDEVEHLQATVVGMDRQRKTEGGLDLYRVRLVTSGGVDVTSAMVEAGVAVKSSVTTRKYPSQNITTGTKKNAVASHVESPTSFYVQLTSSETDINNMVASLHKYYTQPGNGDLFESEEVGGACVGMDTDNQWYRAVLVKQEEDGHTIRFVDFGNSSKVTSDKVKVIEEQFMSSAPLAIHCSLEGVGPDDCTDAVKQKFDQIMNNEVVCEFVGVSSEECCSVILTDKQGNAIDLARLTGATAASAVVAASVAAEATVTSSTERAPRRKPSCSYKRLEKTISKGDTLVGDVMYVDYDGIIYIQRPEDGETLEGIMASLAGTYPELGLRDGELDDGVPRGEPCAAKFSDDETWYRAEVIGKKTSEGLIPVRFVDYGNGESCQPFAVKKIESSLLEHPALAFKCMLAGLPADNADIVNSLSELINGVSVTATVVNVTIKGVLMVKLTLEDGKDVGTELGVEGGAEESKEQKISGGVIPEEAVEVYVTHVVSPSEFYIQFSTVTEELEKISADLQTVYEGRGKGHKLSVVPDVGQNCCARFSADAQWYRAEVLEVEQGERARVLFVDYGNSDTVSLVNDVRILDEQFYTQPACSYRCCLSGRADITWSDGDVERFSELTAGGEVAFMCEFKELTGQSHQVLLKTYEDENVNDMFSASTLNDDEPATYPPADVPSPSKLNEEETNTSFSEQAAGYPGTDAPDVPSGLVSGEESSSQNDDPSLSGEQEEQHDTCTGEEEPVSQVEEDEPCEKEDQSDVVPSDEQTEENTAEEESITSHLGENSEQEQTRHADESVHDACNVGDESLNINTNSTELDDNEAGIDDVVAEVVKSGDASTCFVDQSGKLEEDKPVSNESLEESNVDEKLKDVDNDEMIEGELCSSEEIDEEKDSDVNKVESVSNVAESSECPDKGDEQQDNSEKPADTEELIEGEKVSDEEKDQEQEPVESVDNDELIEGEKVSDEEFDDDDDVKDSCEQLEKDSANDKQKEGSDDKLENGLAEKLESDSANDKQEKDSANDKLAVVHNVIECSVSCDGSSQDEKSEEEKLKSADEELIEGEKVSDEEFGDDDDDKDLSDKVTNQDDVSSESMKSCDEIKSEESTSLETVSTAENESKPAAAEETKSEQNGSSNYGEVKSSNMGAGEPDSRADGKNNNSVRSDVENCGVTAEIKSDDNSNTAAVV